LGVVYGHLTPQLTLYSRSRQGRRTRSPGRERPFDSTISRRWRCDFVSSGRKGVPDEADARMVFTKRLRDGVRRGRIRCSVRVWMRPHVKVGGRYPMDDGHIVVDSIEPITIEAITYDLDRKSAV